METCICMDSLIISLHGNVNNSKFIKKNTPESRPATPLRNVLVTRIHYATELLNMATERLNMRLFCRAVQKQLLGQMSSKLEEICTETLSTV